MVYTITTLCLLVAVVAAYQDDVISKFDDDLRYQYVEGPDGNLQMVDLWLRTGDLLEAARFNPDRENVYHLFTRQNPSISQPLLYGNEPALAASHYNVARRSIVLIHGWQDTVTSNFNTALVPAILESEDVNVIVVDWSAGAATGNYIAAVTNTPLSGQAVARFLLWLQATAGLYLERLHIIGHGLGGHQAGIVGRNLGRGVSYITGLDPSFAGWATNNQKFTANDGTYTEVIHTNAGLLGYLSPLAHADFYPNGGVDMPGCISQECDHNRSFFFMAESIRTGGFTGSRCATFISAMSGNCFMPGSLRMGGLLPKTGSTGIYWLRTFPFPPFSRY